MSDFDEYGRRIPDWDELEDAGRERQAKLRVGGPCVCGNDLPGQCPGRANCPMCQESVEFWGR